MANEKILNTRVLLKTDTLANWNSSTLGLKKGEIAIATVAATAGSGLTEPVCMIKVGEDGVKKFNELPWSFYAKASDVYAWAKESTISSSVVGEGNAFTNVEWDATLNGGKGGLKFTKGTTFATKAEFDSITDTNTITTVELITAEGDAHKGQIKVSVQRTINGENDGTATVTYIDVVTPAELTETLKGYVTSVTAGDDSITINNSSAQAPKVAVKLDPTEGNAIKLVSGKGLRVDVPAAAEYSVVKDDNSGDYAAVYHLTKDGVNTGAAINIPKDMVVQSGSVVTNPEGQPAGTYIKLVLQNVADPLYINVGSLIEYVTSGSQTGDMVVVAVSDDHKVTATITDGTVTKAKLATEVQTSLGLADNSVQKETGQRLMTDEEGTKLEGIAAGAQVNVIETVKVNGTPLVPDGSKAVDVAVPTGALASKDKVAETDLETALAKKITAKANDADLATIAKTGNVNDLIQTAGDILVFDCGSSSANI